MVRDGAGKLRQGGRPPDVEPVNVGQQALEAREQGVADIVRLLQQPEDLARLPQLRAEYDQKFKSNKQQLSATVQSQVEAARYGLELLDKSHRHIGRLRGCIDQIDRLCAECASLVENHDKIRALSYAHKNVEKVLEELSDIIDLPARAAMVEQLLENDESLLNAYEGLCVLAGTASNVKEAWARNVKKSQGIGELQQYLTKVGETMTDFERKLWSMVRQYHELAKAQPRKMVEVCRILEVQEQIDAAAAASGHANIPAKHFKEKALLEIESAIQERFAPLHVGCASHGKPNAKLKRDQQGNRVVQEERDYLGALTALVRVDGQGRQLPPLTDAEMSKLVLTESDVFDEDTWVDGLLQALTAMEAELPEVFDFVAPCFPPSFRIFDAVQQAYHLQFAQAVDVIGQSAEELTTKSQLKLMEWVAGYQATLRNLGVEEELVHLPIAPMSDPEGKNGLSKIVEVYTDRMDATVNAWIRNILEADMAQGPRQMVDGLMRTMGSIDFFRILNEQVAILEDISRGEALFEAARRAMKIMTEFTEAQGALLARGLELEMLCALCNNNLDCYEQSLEFAEHVQSLLEERYADQLEVEDVCRGFLDLAKGCASRVVDLVMSDAGLVDHFAKLYRSQEWLTGATTGTIVATIQDYFGDINTYVSSSFRGRAAEAALDMLVARFATALLAACPGPSEGCLRRLEADEAAIQVAFQGLLKPERVRKATQPLAELRELMTVPPEGAAAAFSGLLECSAPGGGPLATPEQAVKLAAGRGDLSKQQLAELLAQFKDLAATHRGGSAVPAADTSAKGGWKFWGGSRAAAAAAARVTK